MRRVHGSRRAGIVEEASPPNSLFRYGQGVGPRGIPTGLSAGIPAGALSAYRKLRLLWEHRGAKELSVGGVSLPTFLLLQPTDKKKDGGHSHEI